jgi:hypothetical protein
MHSRAQCVTSQHLQQDTGVTQQLQAGLGQQPAAQRGAGPGGAAFYVISCQRILCGTVQQQFQKEDTQPVQGGMSEASGIARAV